MYLLVYSPRIPCYDFKINNFKLLIVIAGSKQAVVQALSIIQDLGPPLGLVINSSKCELYGDCDLQPFPSEMKKCNAFNFEILGAPIGDTIFCAKFIAEK